jgi:triphosphoribosyl-dephospho-CoA synthetase
MASNKAKRIPRAIGNCARRYTKKSSRADLKDPEKKEKHYEKQSLHFEWHQEGEGDRGKGARSFDETITIDFGGGRR